ncbi:cadherin domain-containing protein [Nocardioides sp. CN2-186]|uniref:cadherin repeat domain-containing protein n=1 Tax=Nocardioides tweenelious TaxID=3156607 RepID=UPI0032B567A1
MRALLSTAVTAVVIGGLLVGSTATPTSAANVNHRPGPVSITSATVPEDAAPGTLVGTMSAPDQDPRHVHAFRLVSGKGDRDNGLFSIEDNRLSTAAVLDFETRPVLQVRVRVTDKRGATRASRLQIAVGNVNEAPTDITLAPASVPEGLVYALAGTLTASDPDTDDTHSFVLVPGAGDADNARFRIEGDQVRTVSGLDYETQSTYTVRVRVTDTAGATYEKALTITATDTDETPAPTPLSNLTLSNDSVDEEQPAGALVGQAHADGDGVTYSLVAGRCAATPGRRTCRIPASRFTVSPAGEVRTGIRFDFEDSDSWDLTVRATDRHGATLQETFTISINDVNEAPTDIMLSGSSVVDDENYDSVGTLSATDQDAGDTATYSLVGAVDQSSGDVSSAFVVYNNCGGPRLVANTGMLTPGTYTVTIRVTDGGGLSYAKAFTVTVVGAARVGATLRRC